MQSAYPDGVYRINSTVTPTVPATSACRGSVVSVDAPLCWARARQAQSPSERRTLRGAERSSPAALAWARSSATTSRSSSRKSASASFPSRPRSTSFAITSARFAALITASGSARSTRSAPGSSNNRQSKAEASRTCPPLLTIRLRPTLRNQLVRHVTLVWCEGAELGLDAAQGGAGRADPQLIAVQFHEHGVTFRQSHALAKRGRHDDPVSLDDFAPHSGHDLRLKCQACSRTCTDVPSLHQRACWCIHKATGQALTLPNNDRRSFSGTLWRPVQNIAKPRPV